ncbi:uncharacterized protein LOC132038645 [Lycium ferocissimum]|uniref:uncharacterized protein LOC132038645 n=1 Tax=Lycium ferocissimum TaxID=112874 RepID=UPI002816313B|nr:uncharacterized protein LOC132038645 [Lycium ferocissimum]
MQNHNLSVSKTLNPTLSTTLQSPSLIQFFNPLVRTLPLIPSTSRTPKPLTIQSHNQKPKIFLQNDVTFRRDIRSFAGRKKENSGGGRIEGSAEFRRQAKRNARRKSKKLAESLFYRLKNPHGNYPDNFSEEELQMIGLGYDRMVRFMEKDDPNLKHPYDWYKYGQFGPYSWRGVVLGEPIRGRFSDECVSMIGEVKDQEEWEKIEQHEMAQEFQNRLDAMDKNVGFRYFWVFVRHPKWRISDFPWQQWTLVSEVVVEAGNERLDKWNLMGRLGNKARSLITQCAAWMRPDIVYVQRPVYQCRFEPQDDFFKALTPLLDPESEEDFMFELEDDNGRVQLCTYFGGLCKIVRVNPKAFVDDVVKGYEKLSDEKKSKCLMFLLGNHPVHLLHPYTKEWKAKLEDMEMGCDAPDDDDDYGSNNNGETEIVDWIEDDEDGEDGDEDEGQYDVDLDASGDEDDEDDGSSQEEDARFWDDEFKKALGSNQAMEKFAKKYMETTTKFYEKHIDAMEEREKEVEEDGGDELAMRGVRAKVSPTEWENFGFGPFRRKLKKGKMPPELFMKAAVRPFTYKNLVKEIVLTRHAILEGEIGQKK